MTQNDLIQMMMAKCSGNPMAMNVMNMIQKNDTKGLEQMARNLCKEKGTTPEEVMRQVKQRFGI